MVGCVSAGTTERDRSRRGGRKGTGTGTGAGTTSAPHDSDDTRPQGAGPSPRLGEGIHSWTTTLLFHSQPARRFSAPSSSRLSSVMWLAATTRIANAKVSPYAVMITIPGFAYAGWYLHNYSEWRKSRDEQLHRMAVEIVRLESEEKASLAEAPASQTPATQKGRRWWWWR